MRSQAPSRMPTTVRALLACLSFVLIIVSGERPAFGADAPTNSCSDVGDLTSALLERAVSKVADNMTDQVGKRALLEIYRNARRNHPEFPVGLRNPLFTSRAESAALGNSVVLQTLKHLTLIRDAVIAPTEALLSGDRAGAWAAIDSFASDQAVSFGLGLMLGPVPTTAAVSALKVYQESVAALRTETCLLNVDLEYYALTMSDPRMKMLQGTQRLDYYINSYLVGAGPSPVGEDRSVHRERAQCFLDQHLSSDLSGATVSTGRTDPFGRFIDAVSGVGTRRSNPAYRSAIQTMLGHFDQLAALEASRRDLMALGRDPGYRALKAATEALTPEQAEDLVGRICSAAAETPLQLQVSKGQLTLAEPRSE